MSESEIQAQIMREIGGRKDCRIFRNNQAFAWVGERAERYADGSIRLYNARPLHAGLHSGAADLIGWASEIIGPSHVGYRVGRFLSIEVKSSTGRPSDAQENWHRQVRRAGGNAMIVRSVEDAIRRLHDNPSQLETL